MQTLDWSALGEEAVAHFKALLQIPTVNPPGNERPAAEYVASVLAKEGIEYVILESAPTRASVVARLRGNGKKGPLLLNGHLDVVPVDRDQWTHDPFAAVEADGCIWGRGAIDMKNMVAMSLMTMIILKRSNIELDRDIIFAAVADEEAGSNHGALFLVEKHPDLVKADYVLNEVGGHTLHMGATRFYPIQVSEKGICWFELEAKGDPGHGSMPHPANSVVRLARAVTALADKKLPLHITPVVEKFFQTMANSAPVGQKQLLRQLLSPTLSGPMIDLLFKMLPERAKGLNAMLRNTASPTILNAGQKVNVIPSSARVEVDGRVIPGQTSSKFLAEIEKVVGHDLRIKVNAQHDGTVFSSETPLYDEIERVLLRHDPGGIAVPYMIPGFTDSFAYARLGAVCYGFSPVQLDPGLEFTSMYHGHNERIPRQGFLWGQRVLYEVVHDFCASSRTILFSLTRIGVRCVYAYPLCSGCSAPFVCLLK